jgi:hypothetical protein
MRSLGRSQHLPTLLRGKWYAGAVHLLSEAKRLLVPSVVVPTGLYLRVGTDGDVWTFHVIDS